MFYVQFVSTINNVLLILGKMHLYFHPYVVSSEKECLPEYHYLGTYNVPLL
jgi:hypothetical protein